MSIALNEVDAARKLATKVVSHPLYEVVQSRLREADGYFVIDTETKMPKPKQSSMMTTTSAILDRKVDPTVELLISQLETARGMVRAGLGNKPIRMDLVFDVSGLLLATVTSGVVANVTILIGSAASEWSSLAALFDEYKIMGADVHFETTSYSNGTTSDNFLVIAYDPVDSTPLTTTLAGITYAQHKTYAFPSPTGSATGSGTATYPRAEPLNFRCTVPKGINVVTGAIGEGSWSGCPLPGTYGYIKTYWIQNIVTATRLGAAYIVMHAEFRCRQ